MREEAPSREKIRCDDECTRGYSRPHREYDTTRSAMHERLSWNRPCSVKSHEGPPASKQSASEATRPVAVHYIRPEHSLRRSQLPGNLPHPGNIQSRRRQRERVDE
jgi:hypothetical protein